MPVTKPATAFEDVAPWPGENKFSPPAGMGHNMPPPEEVIPQEFRSALLDERPDFLVLLDNYLGVGDPNSEAYKPGAVQRAKCDSEETLAKCGSLIATLRKCEQYVDEVHKDVKAPYLQAGRLVDAEKNALQARIAAGKQAVEAMQSTYVREKRRLAMEAQAEADRQRRELEALAAEKGLEAALPPPPAPAPSAPTKIRSDDGVTVSTTTEWCCHVESYPKAVKHVLNDAKVQDAIDAAIKRIVKATKGKPLAGVRIWDDVKALNR